MESCEDSIWPDPLCDESEARRGAGEDDEGDESAEAGGPLALFEFALTHTGDSLPSGSRVSSA